MANTDQQEASPPDRLARATDIAVPVGFGVVTWLVVALLAGYLLRLGSLSLINLLPLFVFGILLWPIVAFEPWREAAPPAARDWLRRNRSQILLAGLLVALLAVPFVPDLIARGLALPFRASGIFFGASVFYRQRLGATVGQALFRFGQWYLVALWFYVLASVLVSVGRWAR